jgi:hypothetical protein
LPNIGGGELVVVLGGVVARHLRGKRCGGQGGCEVHRTALEESVDGAVGDDRSPMRGLPAGPPMLTAQRLRASPGGSKRARMAVQRLMIRCPKTGKAVPTGIAMDPASYVSADLESNVTRCPYCGEGHRWSKEQVFWETESAN